MTEHHNLETDCLYYGDCLEVMKQWPDQCIDLIYLDPPFNSKANYNQTFGKGNGVPAQVRAFTDTWIWNEAAAERTRDLKNAVNHPAHKAVIGLETILGESGMLAYLTYIAERLAVMKKKLKDTGSIYLHCDPTASHYLKMVMDCVLGAGSFRNEITWKRHESHNNAKGYGNIADIILFYVVGNNYIWNQQCHKYSDAQLGRYKQDENGRLYRGDDLTAPGTGINDPGRYIWRGSIPGKKRRWAYTLENMEKMWKEGLILTKKDGNPRLDGHKKYLDESEGHPVQNIWIDIPRIANTSKEKLDYETQKPVALLERIIKASSNEGDVVCDPFMGGGTTLEAAHKLDRKWIGIDISPRAIDLVKNTRFKNPKIPAYGIPTDMESARMMLDSNPYDFEAWAVTRVAGLSPNEIKTGDGGIDGRGKILTPIEPEQGTDQKESGLVIAQVKGGNYTATALRDFLHVMEREKASVGIFITMNRTTTNSALAEAGKLGNYKIGASPFPRLQFWSVEEYFEGHFPRLPVMADPDTGKALQETLPMN